MLLTQCCVIVSSCSSMPVRDEQRGQNQGNQALNGGWFLEVRQLVMGQAVDAGSQAGIVVFFSPAYSVPLRHPLINLGPASKPE